MTEDIKLEILPSGHIRFKRKDEEYNKRMRKIILSITDDEKILNQLDEFFKGSEETELLIGSEIFCG